MTVRGVSVERRGPVGWLIIEDYQAAVEAGFDDPDYIGVHEGVGLGLDELRYDDSVRVVVLTGRNDGEFYRFARRSHWDDARYADRHNPLRRGTDLERRQSAVRRPNAHELLLLIEKPVIARVNGDAIGFGSSLLWGCDLIIAREDARVAWGHTGLGEIVDGDGEARGFPWAMTPCYGMASLEYLPPTLTKESMMLSRVFTGRELADANVFNAAVPAGELDATVDELVEALLRRPASVLARTKRLCNKQLIESYNLAEHLAAAYGALDFYDEARAGKMG